MRVVGVTRKVSHHKTELIIVHRIDRVLHNLGLQLGVGPGHQVDPDKWIRASHQICLGESLALHHRDVQLLGPVVVTDLRSGADSDGVMDNDILPSGYYCSYDRYSIRIQYNLIFNLLDTEVFPGYSWREENVLTD